LNVGATGTRMRGRIASAARPSTSVIAIAARGTAGDRLFAIDAAHDPTGDRPRDGCDRPNSTKNSAGASVTTVTREASTATM
jgi:hypothetical protein